MASPSNTDTERKRLIVTALCKTENLDPEQFLGDLEKDLESLILNIMMAAHNGKLTRWITFAKEFPSEPEACLKVLDELNEDLMQKSVLLGRGLKPSEADIVVFEAVHSSVSVHDFGDKFEKVQFDPPFRFPDSYQVQQIEDDEDEETEGDEDEETEGDEDEETEGDEDEETEDDEDEETEDDEDEETEDDEDEETEDDEIPVVEEPEKTDFYFDQFCNICRLDFFSRSKLFWHQRRYHPDARYECFFCPKRFLDEFTRDTHITARHDSWW